MLTLIFTASKPVLAQCVNITIIQDGAIEATEVFFVEARASGNLTGLLNITRIFIVDRDRK